MPMYRYICRECEQPFEKKLSMSQAGEAQECPCCGSRDTRKRLGAVSLGSGATPTRSVSQPTRTSPFT